MRTYDEAPGAALLVACPYCKATAGEDCTTTMKTIDRGGRPHQARLDALRKARRAGALPDAAQPRLL